MNKKEINNLVLLIILGLVILAVGGGLGIYYQLQKDNALIKSATESSLLAKSLSSAVIPSIIVYGQVDSVNGKVITLSYQGNTLSITAKNGIVVNSYTPSATGVGTTSTASFSDIKKGDVLNIAARMLPSGQLEAQTIMIVSPTAK